MAEFITRVELTDANSDDYSTLHEEMDNEGFTKTIKDGNGIEYKLPDATYSYVSSVLNKSDVLQKAKKAASKTNKSYKILVTQSAGSTWIYLDKVK
ncbi:type V toxin-antitoxin system endoribonuclease antitoxin GhoS [Empedobacter brevis]|uniref:Type V toxin-antitoxin system endoribonuclease antitoxin GhoS n=1 Tax=Empedobacter brevis TaxID=247 RepID=A0AAJ1QBN2_9FLAO|nr:hypothetical protein [Empedobacter brevis]MDM1071081.1 type V toxin-antitoxin system endoribonuclease antitoxin GhoS [Empedobacter brevis]